jgi:DNA-binding NtrC family response regulator
MEPGNIWPISRNVRDRSKRAFHGIGSRGLEYVKNLKVLVVEDDPAMRAALEVRIRSWNFDVMTAADGAEGREVAEEWDPDIVLTDLVMPELSGMDLLRALKQDAPHRHVLLVTAEGGIDDAVEAMKQGARDFLTKPLDYEKLRSLLDEISRDLETRRRAETLSGRISGTRDGLIGQSKRIREVFDLIERVAATDTAALITGESGTGKELVARRIHSLSRRASQPFVAVNAAAVPEGLVESEFFGHEKGAFTGAIAQQPGCFELANGGTLFLDEIGEMPVSLQPKLLRVLNDGCVRRLGGRDEIRFDVRVIAATNQDPARAIEEKSFREDLYYRLAVFTIPLPPLRDRKSDIPLIAQHFVQEFRDRHKSGAEGIRESALDCLRRYSWPGNVRELRNVIERAVVLADGPWLETWHLPPYVREPEKLDTAKVVLKVGSTTVEDAERELILKTLEKVGNNKAEAARLLGVDVKTIRNKLGRYQGGEG